MIYYSLRPYISVRLENFRHITTSEKWSYYPKLTIAVVIENRAVYLVPRFLINANVLETEKSIYL